MQELTKENKLTNARIFIIVGLFFFVYSWSVGVAIQTYFVPKIFPQFNYGEGIVTLDATGFNRIAKTKAKEIRKNGWSAWELRPEALSPAGIASIFYTLWAPKPYSMLPFNALIHALSGCLVLLLLRHLFSWKSAIFGCTLFVINPAAMQWVAQIHRDGVFILGNLMILACLVQFWYGLKSTKVRVMTWGIVLGVTGSALVWIARPYWIQVLMITLILGSLIIGISCRSKRVASNKKGFSVHVIIPFILIPLLFQGWLVKQDVAGLNMLVNIPQEKVEIAQEKAEIREDKAELVQKKTDIAQERTGIREAKVELPQDKVEIIQEKTKNPQEKAGVWFGMKTWKYTKWVPESIESKLYQISIVRSGALNTGGNTVVDTDVALDSVIAFVKYFPRALQLGFLSPLPELWQGEGSTPTMTIARKVMGIVTFIFYFFLVGSVVGIYLLRRNALVWLVLMFCFLGIMIFIYAYPNIGTFLRFRYGFYMLLVAFGAANIAELSVERCRRHQCWQSMGTN